MSYWWQRRGSPPAIPSTAASNALKAAVTKLQTNSASLNASAVRMALKNANSVVAKNASQIGILTANQLANKIAGAAAASANATQAVAVAAEEPTTANVNKATNAANVANKRITELVAALGLSNMNAAGARLAIKTLTVGQKVGNYEITNNNKTKLLARYVQPETGVINLNKPDNRNINNPLGNNQPKIKVSWVGNKWQIVGNNNKARFNLKNNSNKISAPVATVKAAPLN